MWSTRDVEDFIVMTYRRRYWPNRKCKRCRHILDEHWWEEPEFHCLIGWGRKEMNQGHGGCECGQFEGLDWLDVTEALGPQD